ncbi:ATP-dependent DNA ligase [Rathayibacter rathayi]|uniref:ATP-dependent DNA ligase n=1 Tax=Rathayibacter rathayi TaxID=33887 RepID=A0ABD6WBR7_RATRA|nr:ATP-dependent DNA ligase [Rathayibacter rathayi]PPF16006.1 ATP-dependent DNA ligase [Rathayibacter rathayi]PPF22781.1 ATP-dependent DNA ligase [Rathayibacter rathayi]PPG66626.1 ATP-dependent DNA ligase [Rathayibacter rathayi]PPG78150.1 ATP-dependent DNA ligase [Rathayibacter rathayi]PPG93798.1 ATP-dependent DNA ligase [Rathayibacter rathayi]
MGKLLYGASGVEIEFDDRTLTHVQIVIANKLRRRESFFFSWRDDPAVGDGRSSIWLDPSVPLYFRYFGARVPSINRTWIDLLSVSANSSGGLQLTQEPDTAPPPPPKGEQGA